MVCQICSKTHTQIYVYIFVGVALSYADPVWDRRPRNRSAIPTTGMVRRVQRYKFIQIGRPGLAATAQTVLAWPATYEKTPVQSGANLTVYIRTISERVDLTCILYIF